jgi:hypothetical protein
MKKKIKSELDSMYLDDYLIDTLFDIKMKNFNDPKYVLWDSEINAQYLIGDILPDFCKMLQKPMKGNEIFVIPIVFLYSQRATLVSNLG